MVALSLSISSPMLPVVSRIKRISRGTGSGTSFWLSVFTSMLRRPSREKESSCSCFPWGVNIVAVKFVTPSREG